MEAPRLTASPGKLERASLAVGITGLALCLLGAFISRAQFFQSYLFAYVFWLGIALGCLGIVMLHNLSGGAWGMPIRRLLECGMKTLPFMAVLFVPLLFGLRDLYEWARPEVVAGDTLLQHKSIYLNIPFFLVRALLYFALWIGGAILMSRSSTSPGEHADPRAMARVRIASGPGLALLVLTITFASIDWVMSLEAHWHSTIFGVHFLGGHGLAAFAFAIAFAGLSSRRDSTEGRAAWLDLGNLLLGFVMLWAYFAFSQWLIIWSGNLPEEAVWYTRRNSGGWEWFARLLVAFHFFVPFLLLLSRRNKQNPEFLALVAAAVLVMRLVDVFWYTAPAFRPGEFSLHWLDIVAPIALGGIWLAAFLWQLRRMPSMPVQDPAAREALSHG